MSKTSVGKIIKFYWDKLKKTYMYLLIAYLLL